MSYYLITTADERAWVFDRPVLFLGEWCRRYNRQQIWSTMDGVVAAPYGLERAQRLQDIEYTQSLAKQLLSELTETLNTFHQTQHNQRYWNILLGHWVQRYVSIAFNRYQVLRQALQKYEITGTTIFEAKNYSLATMDSESFVNACNNDQWNHVFFSRILNALDRIRIYDNPEPLKNLTGFFPLEKMQNSKNKNMKTRLLDFVRQKSSLFSRDADAFIINSYLPLKESIKLQLSLGQVPQFWRSPDIIRVSPDNQFRKKLKIPLAQYQGFEKYVREQLPNLIPSCYVEGYRALEDKVKSLNWPKKPRFILTSNNFDTDEVFKFWVGAKVNEGVPYFVGQHGNNYGTSIEAAYYPELRTCDYFITWGWHQTSKTLPAFLFRQAGKKTGVFDRQGDLLLIQLHPPHWKGPADDYYNYGLYQDDQFKFVNALPPEILQRLIIRLHSGYQDFQWFDAQRWQDHDHTLVLEKGQARIEKLMAQSRFTVHSYDSTGILEGLYLNIPTIGFWHHGLDHLVAEAKPYYQLLRDVGILHDTPEEAAQLIAVHWDNPDAWWASQAVQTARMNFCNQYAKRVKHPIRTLKSLLTIPNPPTG